MGGWVGRWVLVSSPYLSASRALSLLISPTASTVLPGWVGGCVGGGEEGGLKELLWT